MKGKASVGKDKCRFCGKERSEEERRHKHGLCRECFHLRRIIRRIGWHKRRVGVTSDQATGKRILSWLCSGQGLQKS